MRAGTAVDDLQTRVPANAARLYYVVVSLEGGGLGREPVGHNRKEAERRLRAIEVPVDQSVYSPPENVTVLRVWPTLARRAPPQRDDAKDVPVSLKYAKQAIGNEPLQSSHVSTCGPFSSASSS